MSSEVIIRVERLSKSYPIYAKPHHRLLQMVMPGPKERWYRRFDALRDVSLEVRRGETVGIVGRNGSGKSTLLQLICGTVSPTAGTVTVGGRIAALLELGAGFNPEFTGRENIFLNGTVLGLNREQIKERFDDIVAFAEIGDFIDQPVKTYSSGMFVRLAFAVAISVTPDVLIVDEALSVGDEAFQRKCFAKIEEIRSAGATILFVSHSAGTVVDLCDRAVLLDHGELLAIGAPRRIVSLYQKLLYAPPERVGEVRRAIAQGDGQGCLESGAALGGVTTDESPLVSSADAGWWDEGLAPSSTVVYENRGALIEDPHLETLDGRRVNVLVPGQSYLYTYRVHFDRGLAFVRCGMMIKTVTGIEVAGAATAPQGSALPYVVAGQALIARFNFRCLLAPGTYFLNAGVVADSGRGEEYVDRRVDVAMFRVLPDTGRLATGLVDLDVRASLEAA